MNDKQKATLKMLRESCGLIALIRKCAVGAEEFTEEEIDEHIGKLITDAVEKYDAMTAREIALELITRKLAIDIKKELDRDETL